jgi:hypothetical protein
MSTLSKTIEDKIEQQVESLCASIPNLTKIDAVSLLQTQAVKNMNKNKNLMESVLQNLIIFKRRYI